MGRTPGIASIPSPKELTREPRCPGSAAMPGNVFVPAAASGLPRDSVVNVTALVTLDKTDLDPAIGQLPASLMHPMPLSLIRSWNGGMSPGWCLPDKRPVMPGRPQ